MKVPQIFSIIALLSAGVLSIPSQALLKDDQAFNSPVTSTGGGISSGIYVIDSPYFQDESFRVGRGREDFSLLPKRIIVISKDAGYARIQWNVQQLDNGNYRLSIGGAPTAQINNALFALLIPSVEPAEWKITYRPNHQAYTIELANDYQGWIVGDPEEETQIQVRPLIVRPSEPPFFPSSELFTFESLDDSDSINGVFHEKSSHAGQGVHVDITVSIEGL